MNNKVVYILILGLSIFTSCSDSKVIESKIELIENEYRDNSLIRINYDFENLGLNLNSLVNDSISKIDWRWDYMNSDGGKPDTTGIDYYMNINQPVFSFNGETTLPTLSVKTYKKRIIEFSVTTIFQIQNNDIKTLESLMDNLIHFDLLKNESVRKAIINEGRYQNWSEIFEEEISLKFGKNEYDYDRMTYKIKTQLNND